MDGTVFSTRLVPSYSMSRIEGLAASFGVVRVASVAGAEPGGA
jgi:hypothetical protein